MIGKLQLWKESLESCKDSEEEMVERILRWFSFIILWSRFISFGYPTFSKNVLGLFKKINEAKYVETLINLTHFIKCALELRLVTNDLLGLGISIAASLLTNLT